MSFFFDHYPYTNFHNINLDWVLEAVKAWGNQVESLGRQFTDLKSAWYAFKDEINIMIEAEIQEFNDAYEIDKNQLQVQYQQFTDYVTGYLNNLDYETVIQEYLANMVTSGELRVVIAPTVAETVTEWLDDNVTPTTPIIDSTLTISGAGADSKVTGERIQSVLDDISLFPYKTEIDKTTGTVIDGYLSSADNGQIKQLGGTTAKIFYFPCKANETYRINHPYSGRCGVGCFDVVPRLNAIPTRYIVATDENNFTSYTMVTTDSTCKYLACYYYTSRFDLGKTENEAYNALKIYCNSLDDTLKIDGVPCNSKTVGDAINNLSSDYENLFYVTNALEKTVNGITIRHNSDGSYTFNGTSISTCAFPIMGAVSHLDISLKAGSYTFDREIISYDTEPTKNPFFWNDDTGAILLNTNYTFNTDVSLYIRCNADYTFNNVTYKFTLRKSGTTANDEVVRNLVLKDNNVRLLFIGNSYTRDSIRWLSKILYNNGINAIVGHGYIGSITLNEQYSNYINQSANYTYYKYNRENQFTLNNKSLNYIVNDEQWDYVIFQQQSDESGQYNSFVSDTFDINTFINAVTTAINNAELKIGLFLPWSHASGYNGEKFIDYYNGDATVQFNAIIDVIPRVAKHIEHCDFIINAGYAIKFGRTDSVLSELGDELLRSDKNHLYYGIPSYMIGLLIAKTLFNVDMYNTWYPTSADEGVTCITNENYARIARLCVINAYNTII